jgi:hypothetical protein
VLYVVLLIIFLIQFLVALGVLMFVIFLVRPEAPFSGDGPQQASTPDDRGHLLAHPYRREAPDLREECIGVIKKAYQTGCGDSPSHSCRLPPSIKRDSL